MFRLGTRGSTLARRQSSLIAEALQARGVRIELITIVTEGDIRPPDTAWGEGVFVGALEAALRDGSVDIAVHSAKDVPIEPEEDLVIAAFPSRADPRDALVAGAASLVELPGGARVGTDSPRRTGFLRAARADLDVVPLSGNVDSRLRRLDDGEVDALVLAVAGLERLGLSGRISQILAADVVPPAPGQGALAVQVRRDAGDLRDLVASIDDPATRLAVTAEREVLRESGGGCRAPLGALASMEGDRFTLLAGAVDPSGSGRVLEVRSGSAADALRMARDLGSLLRVTTLTDPGAASGHASISGRERG
jgi:hydroxymethylbilane synthase